VVDAEPFLYEQPDSLATEVLAPVFEPGEGDVAEGPLLVKTALENDGMIVGIAAKHVAKALELEFILHLV
jgi:hypothetical protein